MPSLSEGGHHVKGNKYRQGSKLDGENLDGLVASLAGRSGEVTGHQTIIVESLTPVSIALKTGSVLRQPASLPSLRTQSLDQSLSQAHRVHKRYDTHTHTS